MKLALENRATGIGGDGGIIGGAPRPIARGKAAERRRNREKSTSSHPAPSRIRRKRGGARNRRRLDAALPIIRQSEQPTLLILGDIIAISPEHERKSRHRNRRSLMMSRPRHVPARDNRHCWRQIFREIGTGDASSPGVLMANA